MPISVDVRSELFGSVDWMVLAMYLDSCDTLLVTWLYWLLC
jgi:hypothetical protein